MTSLRNKETTSGLKRSIDYIGDPFKIFPFQEEDDHLSPILNLGFAWIKILYIFFCNNVTNFEFFVAIETLISEVFDDLFGGARPIIAT